MEGVRGTPEQKVGGFESTRAYQLLFHQIKSALAFPSTLPRWQNGQTSRKHLGIQDIENLIKEQCVRLAEQSRIEME